VYLGSYVQNAPEVFQGIYHETGKMEPAVSLLFGSVSAALDAVLPASILKGMTQPVKLGVIEKILERSGMEPSLLRKVVGTIPGATLKEGLTEGAQETINIAAEKFVSENPAIWDSKEFNRIVESSVRGAVAGGTFGGVGAAGARMQESGEEGRVARTAAEEAERQRIAALPPAPPPPEAPGAPTSYATAVQEVERLKREPQTPEVKTRIAELEEYKTQTVMNSLAAAREPISKESIALRKQMMDQQAIQGSFRVTEDLPTREIPAELPEPAGKEIPTIIDASTLDRMGLPKQSGFYKQLLNKDLTNLEDLDAITQIIDKAKTNPRLSASTKQALGDLRWQAMQIYGKQAEMFSPRSGNVLEPIETPELKVTPAAKKIAQVTQNQDMADPAVVEAIRASLIDYANEPTRSAEAINEVSNFLDTLPSAYPESTDVIKSTEPVAPANEPSPTVVSERGEVPAGGTQAPFDFGMGPVATNVEQPNVREAVQPAALTTEQEPTAVAETIAPEIRNAIDLLAAIDSGGIPLNPAKLNNVAKEIGLDVRKSAKPEETIGRIRRAVERAEFESNQAAAIQQPTVTTEAPRAQPTNLPAVVGATAPVRAEQPAPSVPFPAQPTATPMPQAPAATKDAGVPAVTKQPAPAPAEPAQLEGKKRSTALTTESTDIIEGQVRVIDDETLAPLVAQLPAPEQQQLASHYGEEVGSPEFLAKVRKDISDFAVKGAQAVNKAIRDIIRALHAGVLAAAVIFNPAYTSPGYVLAVPQNVTTVEQVLAKVPDSVKDRMSPGAQQAYANIMPAFGAEIKKNNKLFIITDKPNARVFVFDSNGQPILDRKVLLGLQVGDYYKGDPEKLKTNRITSGGLYTMGLRDAKRGTTEWGGDEYATAHDYDFGKVFVLDKALNGTSSVTLFHSVYTKLPDAQRRLAALQKEGPEDSRYSYGCINVDKTTYKYLLDNYQDRMDGAKLFIVPDNPDTTMEFMRGKAINAGDLKRQYVPEVTKEVTKTVPGAPSAAAEKTQMAARKEEGVEETRKPGLYRTVVKSGEGMSRNDVQKIADYVMAHWKNAPETKVIEDITKLPEKLYQQMVRDNAFDAPGVYDPNTKIVYLIAENIPNETEAKLTIAHEALGHFGLQSILGSSYGKVMDDIYNGNQKVRVAAQEKINDGLPKHTAVEEVLAEMAEMGVYNNAIQRAFNAIRQFLRRLGVPMNKITDTEIRELLANSQRFVVSAGPTREGITAFRGKDARFRVGTDAFKRWFGNSVIRNEDGTPKIMYHGTARDIEEFRPKQANAIFLTDDPRFAEDFSKLSEDYIVREMLFNLPAKEKEALFSKADKIAKKNGTFAGDEINNILKESLPTSANILPLYVSAQKPFDYANSEHMDAVVKELGRTEAYKDMRNKSWVNDAREGSWPTIESEPFQTALKALGFDGFYVMEGGRKNLAVYDPGQIKSVFNRGTYDRTDKRILYRKKAKESFDGISESIVTLPPFANDIKEGALDALSRIPDFLRTAALGFLTMPQINQLYGKDLPSLDKLITTLEKRSTSLMNRRQHVSENIKDWYKIANQHKKDLPKFFDIANKTTLDQIDVLDPAMASNPLTKQFKQLPQGLQDVYAGMRKEYDDYSKQFLDLMTANLSGSAASKMRAMFESQRLKVYLPLRRFGDYWLTYKDTSGERVSAAFTSPRQRDLAITDAKKAGATEFKSHARLSQISYRTTPPTGFMGSVVAEMTKGKVDPAVIDNVYQAYMSLFPAESLRQQFRTREGTLGFEKDVFQTYADTASKMVSQLSNMEHAEAIESAVTGIRTEASDTPTTEIRDVVDNLQKQLEFIRNPVNGSLVSKASYFSYMMFIAGNVSSAVVNLTQLPIVVYPLLGGKYGFDNAAGAMQRATSMYYKGGKDNNSEFMPDHTFGANAKGEYKQLYDVAVERAAIRRSTGYELTEARRTSVEDYTGRRAKVEHALGWVFQNSERANREITLIAAFDLARKDGKSVDQAINEALQVVNDAHGASLAEIGPRFFQQGIGKVAFTFKRFAQSQIYLLSDLFKKSMRGADPETKRVARRQLLGIAGMSYLFAGMQGMPLYGAVSLLAEMMLGDDDEPFDMDAEIRAAFGDIGYKGPVNQLLGIDIASRTGFNGMVWRDDPKRLSEVGPTLYALENAAGPAYGAFRSAERGLKLINEGYIERGMEALVPSFVRNGMKAFRLGTEGALTKDGVPIVEDINAYNTLMQVFGFNPAELAETQARAGAMKTAEKIIKERRASLLTRIDGARMSGDMDGVSDTMDLIATFNEKAPVKERISAKTIAQSYETRRRNERESVDGITLDKNMRQELMEKYGQ
jgi:hypothetical protein